jgi:hypothetical protein
MVFYLSKMVCLDLSDVFETWPAKFFPAFRPFAKKVVYLGGTGRYGEQQLEALPGSSKYRILPSSEIDLILEGAHMNEWRED